MNSKFLLPFAIGLATIAIILCALHFPTDRANHIIEGKSPQATTLGDETFSAPSQKPTSIDTPRLPNRYSTRNKATHALEVFLGLKTRANQGDAMAQRELAETYGRCLPVNGNPQKFLASYEAIAQQANSPGNAEGILQVARTYIEECAAVDNGAIVPIEARNLWLEQAAKGGDLAAQAMLYMTSSSRPQGEQLHNFIDRVVNEKDPAALFELGQLLTSNSNIDSLGQYSNVASGPISGYAWSIAACQRGLDCNIGSSLMNSVCINTGGCSSKNFESFVRDYLISTGDSTLLNSKIEEINTILSTTKR